MTPPTDISLELLLENPHWIRGLARRMVRDENSVDDIVQQTYLAALKSPPRNPERVQAWLYSVVGNFVRLGIRERSRRRNREHVAAREESVAAAVAEPVEKEELSFTLAEAVANLKEPYRSTVVRLYFENKTTAEVAELDGVPNNTVRVRLKRALEHLRTRLDRGYERQAWALGLLGLAYDGDGAAALAELAGGATSRFKALAGSVAAVVVLLPLAYLVISNNSWTIGPGTPDQRTSVAAGDPEAPQPGGTAITGRPGLSNSTSTNSDGTNSDGSSASSAESTTSSAFSAKAGGGTSPTLTPGVVSPGADWIPVRVTNAAGDPVPNADIFMRPYGMASDDLARGRSYLDILVRPFATDPLGRTDATGSLWVPRVRLARERLAVSAANYLEHRESARERTLGDEYAVVLSPAFEAELRVTDLGGAAAIGASVRVVGARGTLFEGETDDDGILRYPWREPALALEIRHDGAASMRVAAAAPAQEIQLVPGTSGIGRVTDADGRPVIGCRVRITSPTWIGGDQTVATDEFGVFETGLLPESGRAELTFMHADHPRVTAPQPLPWSEEVSIQLSTGVFVEGRVSDTDGLAVEGRVRAVPNSGRFVSRDLVVSSTDREGAFRLGPLPPGAYTLAVEAPDYAPSVIDLGRVAEDRSRVRVTLGTGTTVRGQVRDAADNPVAGVRIQVGWVCGDEIRGQIVESDELGRFGVNRIPADSAQHRPGNSDLRWAAVAGADAGAWILEVLRPHELVSVDDEAVPQIGIFGSRNTCAVRPGQVTQLTVRTLDLPSGALFSLKTDAGEPLRTLSNLAIFPRTTPARRDLVFGGTDGNPARLQDPGALNDSLIVFISRNRAAGFHYFDASAPSPREVVLPARLAEPQRLRLVDAAGDPVANRPILVSPVLNTTAPLPALYLGTTDEAGELSLSALGGGHFAFSVASDSGYTPPTRALTGGLRADETISLGTLRHDGGTPPVLELTHP